MWKVVRRMERRTWIPSRKYGRLGVTGALAVVAVGLILLVSWILDWRGASAADRGIAELARAATGVPVDLVTAAARTNRIVFISDIHNSTAVKQFAARAIAQIVERPGLDVVVLEVGADLQPYIDQYLDRSSEDASVLLTHGRTLREPGAATRAYLELYRTVRRINQQLGPDQRLRVIAADLPGWPQAGAASPSENARRMAEREEHMVQTVDTLLATMPGARLLIFMTGLHGLKSGTLSFQTGGTAPVVVTPLAARLAQTEKVYTLLVDAPTAAVTGREVAPYFGTRVAGVLDEAGVRRAFGLRITSAFDHLRQPIREARTPGLEFSINPRDYRLRDVGDGYINLGR
jgi:hypothetical protein